MTHFGHACVLVEGAQSRILFDPGMFSSGLDEVEELTAVLVTHQHPDHIDETVLTEILTRNPAASLVVDPGSREAAGRVTDRVRVVQPGERFTVGSTAVSAVGGNHAPVHPDVPRIPNLGYLVDDGAFYHPGDAFDVPPESVDVLGLPIAGSWLKAAEVVEFLRKVSPRVAIPIHEAVLANPEYQYPLYRSLAPSESHVRPLERGVPADV
jgi:L-ascorbate metabolism protein UlaG (beta-lactamase superfamily)